MFGPGYGTGEDVSLINLRLRKEALFCPRHGRLSFGRCPIVAFVAIHFVLRLKNSKDGRSTPNRAGKQTERNG